MTVDRFKELINESILRLPPELKFKVRVGVDDNQPDLAIVIATWRTRRKGFGFIHTSFIDRLEGLNGDDEQGYVDLIMIHLWKSVYNESVMHAVSTEAVAR